MLKDRILANLNKIINCALLALWIVSAATTGFFFAQGLGYSTIASLVIGGYTLAGFVAIALVLYGAYRLGMVIERVERNAKTRLTA